MLRPLESSGLAGGKSEENVERLLTIVLRFVILPGMQVTVSSKYQVVIPKAVRKQLGIQAGQKLDVQADGQGAVLITKRDPAVDMNAWIQKYAGSIKTSETAWGKAGLDATEWLRKQRDEDWD